MKYQSSIWINNNQFVSENSANVKKKFIINNYYMKRSSLKPTYETASSKIAPIPTRRKTRKQESKIIPPFKNNLRSSSPSIFEPHTSDDDQNSVSAYKCGCDYSTDSIHSFKNHVLDAHRGEFQEGSSHFLSGMTKVVLPFIEKNNLSSWSKNELNLKDSEWKTKLKESPHEIWWNGFVLIKHRPLKRDAFYCGHCQLPFVRIIDFINHCLIDCGQLQNEASSHFIYDQTDWKAKVEESQFKLKTKPKPIIEQHKSYKQPQKSKLNQMAKYSKFEDFHEQMVNFAVHYFSILPETAKFQLRKTYIHINDKIIYNNPSQQNSNIKNGSFKCFTCETIFSNKFDFSNHLQVSGEKQDVRSSLLVFNREIFYQTNEKKMKKHLLRKKCQIQNQDFDFDFLKYLAKKETLPLELDTFFQQTLRFEGIIKSFYFGWCNFQQFKCEACAYTTKLHNNHKCYFKQIYAHIYQGNSRCYSQNYAFLYLEDWKMDYTRKQAVLDLRNPYLKDQNFICPCRKTIILSKVQFVNHVVKQHQGMVHIRFYSSPSIFE